MKFFIVCATFGAAIGSMLAGHWQAEGLCFIACAIALSEPTK